MLVGMDSSVTSTYRHLADKVYKNPGTNVFGLFLSPLYIIRWDLPIYNKGGNCLYIIRWKLTGLEE